MNALKFDQYKRLADSTIYSEPDGTFHDGLIEEMTKEFFCKLNLPKHSFILDVGCGSGLFMDLAKDLDYTNLIGVTLSREDAELANAKGHSVLECDMADLPLADGNLDFIWCRHAIEHSPYPLFVLYEFNRLLKVGGQAYIEVPCPDDPRIHEANPNHYSVLGNTMWVALFEKSGFECTRAQKISVQLKHEDKPFTENYLAFVVKKNANLVQNGTKKAG